MVGSNIAERFVRGQSPQAVDRVLLGVCALIWLAVLGTSVAATVALIDLGRGFRQLSKSSHSGLLYIVIGLSALVILAAIPILLRARQGGSQWQATPLRADDDSAERPARSSVPRQRGFDAPGRRAAAARPVMPHQAQMDRVLLRGITVLACAVGTGLTLVAAATYLMAIGRDSGSWICYGVAGAVTAAMPVIPWLYLRRLDEVLALGPRLG